MSYADRLIHTLSVVTLVDTGEVDDYNQPVMTTTTRSVNGLPQPKRIREVTAIHESGATIGTWTVFLGMDTVEEDDTITHVQATCPVPDAIDLPDLRWNVTGSRNPAGVGHHLEVDATAVEGVALAGVGS